VLSTNQSTNGCSGKQVRLVEAEVTPTITELDSSMTVASLPCDESTPFVILVSQHDSYLWQHNELHAELSKVMSLKEEQLQSLQTDYNQKGAQLKEQVSHWKGKYEEIVKERDAVMKRQRQ